jgi:putative nucleotidyltransferase with HDIG domain
VSENRILIADDEEAIRMVVATLLEAQGYHCTTVTTGLRAVELLSNQAFDLVVTDLVMPEMDGMQLLSWVRTHDRDIPVIMVTAMHDVSTALEAMRRGAYDYILKPFERDQLLMGVRRGLEHRRLIVENRNYHKNLERLVQQRTSELKSALSQLEVSYDETLEALGGALDLKDSETEGHCKRVMIFTLEIAKAMSIPESHLPQLARAAFLHDIGKMAIPDRILRKPGPLDDEERATMRTHCEIGYNMVTRIPFLREAAQIVLAHQEYFDGTGYPRGLKGEEIPLGARIFAVADALDAMISDRPYRKALSIQYARAEIKRCSGTQFDPRVVDVFLSLPDSLWLELRENIGTPYRLSHVKTI